VKLEYLFKCRKIDGEYFVHDDLIDGIAAVIWAE